MSGAPPDDAYGRVTNAERFRPVHDAADALVARLVAGYRVECRQGGEPAYEGVTRQVDLVPLLGAPLVVRWDSFPGVSVRYGRWHDEHYPHCGCDACDEDPDQVIEALERKVEAVVSGQFIEAVISDREGTWLTFEIRHRDGGQSGKTRLGEGDPRREEAGEIIWPAWLPQPPEPPVGS